MGAMHPALKVLTIVLAVVGGLAVIGGIIYLAVPARSLPSIFPAHLNPVRFKHDSAHALKHGYAALALGVVLLVAAFALPAGLRRTRTQAQVQAQA